MQSPIFSCQGAYPNMVESCHHNPIPGHFSKKKFYHGTIQPPPTIIQLSTLKITVQSSHIVKTVNFSLEKSLPEVSQKSPKTPAYPPRQLINTIAQSRHHYSTYTHIIPQNICLRQGDDISDRPVCGYLRRNVSGRIAISVGIKTVESNL